MAAPMPMSRPVEEDLPGSDRSSDAAAEGPVAGLVVGAGVMVKGLTGATRSVGGVWVFRTVCFERVVLSSPGCLWPGRMDDHEEVLEAHA